MIFGAILSVLIGVESSAQWRVTDFPHPVYQAKQCGRKEASWICDPNGIISTQDGKRKGGGGQGSKSMKYYVHLFFLLPIMINVNITIYDIK